MTARTGLVMLAAGTLALGGCEGRRMVITSDPSGAICTINDVEVGRTPVEVDFTYFGTYEVRLRKAGYEPLVEHRKAEAPLHEAPGIDLIAMSLPGRSKTILEWHFIMEPADDDPAAIIQRATAARALLGDPSEAAVGEIPGPGIEQPKPAPEPTPDEPEGAG